MSGVVDENVDRAEAIDRRGDHPLAVKRLGDVGFDGQNRRSARLLDRRRRLHERGLGSASEGHRSALARQGARDPVADTRAAAGHDRDPAGKLERLAPFRRSRWIRHAPTRRQAIDWNRRAKALIRFAVSMSRSVIFIPASWVQNENDTTL